MPAPAEIDLPEAALREEFLAATGPGGQNVNKVATGCRLFARIDLLGLDHQAGQRLASLAGSRLNAQGEIVIVARRFRTREANRADARARLAELILRAQIRPQRRIATRPGKSAKEKRLTGKAIRSTVKRGRGRVEMD